MYLIMFIDKYVPLNQTTLEGTISVKNVCTTDCSGLSEVARSGHIGCSAAVRLCKKYTKHACGLNVSFAESA